MSPGKKKPVAKKKAASKKPAAKKKVVAKKTNKAKKPTSKKKKPGKNPEKIEAILREARQLVAQELAQGFTAPGDIVERVVEYLEDEHKIEGLEKAVDAIVEDLVLARRREQKGWPERTDCDKLDAAFEALEQDGIVARQDFTCCMTCGTYEIGDEIQETEAKGREVVGYAFYHRQDLERVAEDGTLYLAYGSTDGTEAGVTAIGHSVVRALEAQGLEVEWDGSAETRILVSGLDWKKRI